VSPKTAQPIQVCRRLLHCTWYNGT